MRFSGMLIHRFCRLRAPVAMRGVEIQRADAVLAGDTLESDAAIHRFGCVMSHNVIVAASSQHASGHWVCNFRVSSRTYVPDRS
jgi:hypothetical protein